MSDKSVYYYTCSTDINTEFIAQEQLDHVIFHPIIPAADCFDPGNIIIFGYRQIDISVEYSCLFAWNTDYPMIGSRSYYKNDIYNTVCHDRESNRDYRLFVVDEIEKEMHRIDPNIIVMLCLFSPFDYCILIPAEFDNTVEEVKKRFYSIAGMNAINPGNHEDEDYILRLYKEEIFNIAVTQRNFRSNPEFKKYYSIIKELTYAPVRNADEAYEYYLIAALQLRAALFETRWRWSNDAGELHYEDSATSDFQKEITYRKRYDLRNFIMQSSPESKCHDLIWSIVFISRGLLASIMDRDQNDVLPNRMKNHPYLNERKDFFGFMPMISERYEEITSYYHDHTTPSYNYGFLAIPYKYANTLWKFFPAYIHEFFHYIAPSNRTLRNDIVLSLTVHAVLNPLCTYICSPDINYTSYYNQIHRYICKQAYMVSDILEPFNKEIKNNVDSMYYISKMSCLSMCNFPKVYDRIVSILQDLPLNENLLLKKRQECFELWSNYVDSYLRTFAIALREIRSDISMYYFLWKNISSEEDYGLKRYIVLLAAEPLFSKYPSGSTADSTILRFGFITRYLVYNLFKEKDMTKLSETWRATVGEIISDLRNALNTDSCSFASAEELSRISDDRLANLIDYIDEYGRMVISGNDGYYTKKYYSLFEWMIYPQMSSNVPMENGLIATWENDIAEIVSHKFPKELKMIYHDYEENAIHGDYSKLIDIEYTSRIVFRHLFQFFPNIDLN